MKGADPLQNPRSDPTLIYSYWWKLWLCSLSYGYYCHGGGGGIRTHGPVKDSGFQDRPVRPLQHPSGLRPTKGTLIVISSRNKWFLMSSLKRMLVRVYQGVDGRAEHSGDSGQSRRRAGFDATFDLGKVADPDSRSFGQAAQRDPEMVPERNERALATHNSEGHFVGDTVAIVRIKCGQPLLKFLLAGEDCIIFFPRQGNGLGVSHKPPSDAGLSRQS